VIDERATTPKSCATTFAVNRGLPASLGAPMRAGLMMVVLVLSSVLWACGKYAPPLPPERFAPSRVQQLQIVGAVDGVSFTWSAPRTDSRGKDLKSIEGYELQRKLLTREADLLDSTIEFEVVSSVKDAHLEELNARREKARAQGLPTRRLAPDPTLTQFSLVDHSVTPGARYVYRLVPINQGGVEGDPGPLIIVTFQGERSDIRALEVASQGDFHF
jgi:hypothetical protein